MSEFDEWFQLNGYGRHGSEVMLWRAGLRMAWDAATSRICAEKDAEIAKLNQAGEIAGAIADEAITKLSEANDLIAMQAEALNCAEYAIANPESDQQFALNAVRQSISASAESVAAWEAKRMEPLRREVAMLRDVLARVDNDAQSGRGKILSCGHTWPCGCSHSDALKVISNTQATAEAYDREHAAKVLEQANALEVAANTVIYCYYKQPKNFCLALEELKEAAANFRAQGARKKEGE